MRSVRRKPTRQRRRRVPPDESRLTVPRAVAALRRGREALCDIQGQLDKILAMLNAPAGSLDEEAPDRLATAKREASQALAALANMRRLLPTR